MPIKVKTVRALVVAALKTKKREEKLTPNRLSLKRQAALLAPHPSSARTERVLSDLRKETKSLTSAVEHLDVLL